jgi:hypothetical protein
LRPEAFLQEIRLYPPHEINEIIIELCAELFADRLKTIWLRAGGKTSDLVNHGTIYDQWVHAINVPLKVKLINILKV